MSNASRPQLCRCSVAGGAREMAAGAEASAEPKLWVVVLSFSIYGALNLFLNFFNKWAMAPSGAGFSLPVFYSTWHMLMSILGSLVLMLWKKPESGIVSLAQFKEYKWETLTLAVCTTVNISCNNASLMLIGLFVNQIGGKLSDSIGRKPLFLLGPIVNTLCNFANFKFGSRSLPLLIATKTLRLTFNTFSGSTMSRAGSSTELRRSRTASSASEISSTRSDARDG